MIESLFLMSASGSAAFLASCLLRRLIGERLSAQRQYAAMKLILLFFLLPIGPCLRFLSEIPEGAAGISSLEAAPAVSELQLPEAVSNGLPAMPAALPRLELSASAGQVCMALWCFCAAGILLCKAMRFARFQRRLQKVGLIAPPPGTWKMLQSCRRERNIRASVQIWISPAAPVPFAAGLRKPAIILPNREFSQKELQYILLHELTHIKSGDLWIRRLSMLAAAIHWWNPLVWLWNRKCIELSEESCDAQVVSGLSSRDRADYGRVLLKTACRAEMPEGLMASLSSAELLQRRLTKMLHAKALTKKQKRLSAGVLAALLLCGSAAAVSAQSPVIIQNLPKSGQVSGQGSDSPGSQGPSTDEIQQDVSTSPAPAEERNENSLAPMLETEQDQARNPGAPASAQPSGDAAGQGGAAEAGSGDSPRIPQTYQNALRGDSALISARGGTPLPDDDPESYYSIDGAFYKLFVSKDHYMMREYDVGNWDSLDASKQQAAAAALVNGDYPRNSAGESYGPSSLANYVGYYPDLIAARGTRGEAGYVRDADSAALPSLPAETCPHEFMVPLYDSEGAVIGEFAVGCGGHFSGGATVDAVKTALGEMPSPESGEALLGVRQ